MNIYIIINIIIVLNVLYIIYINSKKTKETKKLYSKNKFEFTKLINKSCDEKCYLSFYIVNNLTELINKYGFSKVLKYTHSHKNSFISKTGEYPFIFKYDKSNDTYITLLHKHKHIEYSGAGSSGYDEDNQKHINEDVCECIEWDLNSTNGCCVKYQLTNLRIIADKYGEGYFDYPWTNPLTRELVTKRGYIRKVKVSNNKYVYIGSGFTKDVRGNVDYIGIGINILGIILFNIVWYINNLSKYLREYSISFYIITNILFMININFLRTQPNLFDDEKLNIESVTQTSLGITGLNLGLLIFATHLTTFVGYKVYNKFFKLLIISVVFLLLSVVDINTKNNSIILKRKSDIKIILSANGVVILIAALLIILVNKKK